MSLDSAASDTQDASADLAPDASNAAPASEPVDAGTTESTASAPSQLHSEPPASPSPMGAQDASQPVAQPVDWEKRYKDGQSYLTKLAQENAHYKRTWDGIDPQQARQALVDFESRQQVANVSPFNRNHPDYASTKQRVDRASTFLKAAEGLEPDQARAMAHRLGVTADDIRLQQQAERNRAQVIDELHSDPDGFIQSRVESMVHQALQQYDQWTAAKSGADQWLSEKGRADLLKNPDVQRLFDERVPLRERLSLVGDKLARLEALERQVASQTGAVSQAAAQQELLGKRAQGTARSGQAKSRITDGPTYVRETLKLNPSDPRYVGALIETNQRIRNGEL